MFRINTLYPKERQQMFFKTMIRGLLAVALVASAVAAQANQITIVTVPVGNAGNAMDYDNTWCGGVSYAYNIGKYEVTAGQYTAFLNTVATTDTYALYNSNMSNTQFGSGITRSGVSGSYSYTVDTNFVNRPVNYVSFWDSCRFANWLGNGQPTGAQGAGTTETGAYTLTSDGIASNTITRNTGAIWAVTSENEWYKAAYYKGGGINAGYWMLPTGSNAYPGQDMADPLGNNANYFSWDASYPINGTNYTTVGGEYQNSASPYGTFDQGGNVSEWNEWIPNPVARGVRGGSFHDFAGNMTDSFRDSKVPTYEGYDIGFRVSRVSAVPEPSTLALLGTAALGLLGFALHRRKPV